MPRQAADVDQIAVGFLFYMKGFYSLWIMSPVVRIFHPMADLDANYRHMLKHELDTRKDRNSRYSLRSFAKFLKCDATYLSKLMNGRLILSVDLAAEFARHLKLDQLDKREFILSAAEEQRCHALYLIDPSLTDCLPNQDDVNLMPKRRRKKRS